MFRSQKGFTLIELMIVVVIIGILAAIAIPNFIAMQDRAKEGSTKANMHTFQLAAEDYGVQNDGVVRGDDGATTRRPLPGAGGTFKNPFTGTTATGDAWENRADLRAAGHGHRRASRRYADSSTATYNDQGPRQDGRPLTLVLTAGQ